MKKVLGWIFNRWVLGAVLLLALLAVLWIVGPLVSIGEARPLDTDRSRWIATGVLLLVVALVVGWRMWAARAGNSKVVDQLMAAPKGDVAASESADMAAVRQRFEEALGTLRKARFGAAGEGLLGQWKARFGGRYLYELPWYVIIGAPGSGKTTALRNSGLRFPLADRNGEAAVKGVGGTRNCDWWFTDQAVLVDTAGRFTTQDSDQQTDSASWAGFLALLKKARPRQPLNGILVTVSLSDLLARGAADRARHAATVRQRVQELHERLNIRFPIYLLVTKCDLMSGFMDMFGALDKDQRATPWGFTFPLDAAGESVGFGGFGEEFDALVARLDNGLIDRLQAEPDPQRRARIYSFPGQFAGLRDMLREFVEAVFSPSAFEAKPLLRGVYFVSGTQEGTPIDRVLGVVARKYQLERMVLPPNQASGKSFFLSRLLGEVVFAEQGLAGTNRKWERRRSILVMAGYAGVAILAIGTLAAWFISHGNNSRYIEAVSARTESVRRLVQETPNRHSPDLVPIVPALEATRNLAAAGAVDGSVPWSMGFGLYQGRKLDTAARAAYERMLIDAVLPRLALRVEEQLRGGDQPESQYEALKAYLMMYDTGRFEAAALKSHIEGDWDNRLGREITPEQREQLTTHLDALLSLGAAVSPLKQDVALVESVRARLAAVPLPQRVYNRMRQHNLGSEFPDFTVAKAGGGNAPLVFTRVSGAPLTKGVPGLYTYNGYHKGFQTLVGDVAKQLADEQEWVLGIKPEAGKAIEALGASDKLRDDVRRIYLNEYASKWEEFIADVRLVPVTSISLAVQTTRVLAAPDTPLIPLLRAMSRETTLLAGTTVADVTSGKLREAVQVGKDKLLGSLGAKALTSGAPTTRIESIVDDRFEHLRRMVTAPDGGKAPIEGAVARLGELQVHLTAVDSALKGGAAPQPSPLPNQIKNDAANAPQPLRGLLESLGNTSSKVALMQLRESLSREVRAQVGEFCQQAITGRYPFDRSSARDVTQADFAAVFGPGGRFEQMQTKLAPYIDTSTRPSWTFRAVDGTPLGTDVGTLPIFQRAAAIRETFFAGGNTPSVRLEFKPVEMDPALTQFVLDVDGQVVRYSHGPQIPSTVQWPGPRGSGVVRVMVTPAGTTGLSQEGPWALFRLFERVSIQPGPSPERFRAVFDLDGRKASFDVTTSSVRNPFRMRELGDFSCPNGL
ncbi:type VI secretion system membrane subunit TssM [Ideonella sp. A 288]|uniref:type VI secretion system membrane subunit TssM n=1 Tax=Ideonella sp. A 288 TaxID=1962181 RepID=UPI000B4BBC17|nr:type VI secretion system membrane subunit TssM [Ideonella sp. A 288]